MKFRKADLPLHQGAKPKVFTYARSLRKSSTRAEQLLWKEVRNKSLSGFKFRRQHPINGFIADFYCHECRLIIEIDGDIHNDPAILERDHERTNQLNALGIQILRFTNQQIFNEIAQVLSMIQTQIEFFQNSKR
jgi:very-short-patch-repair endonuclease